jgi:hypothetical protein
MSVVVWAWLLLATLSLYLWVSACEAKTKALLVLEYEVHYGQAL